jgi:DNA-binding XRE family transcriptional regulator
MGAWVEIDLKVKVPSKQFTLVSTTLTNALDAIGHKVRKVNEDGEELFTFEEVFPDAHPGKVVHGFRVRDGITQEELANRLGIKQHHVSEIETGKRSITIEMAKRFAKSFGTDYRVFL